MSEKDLDRFNLEGPKFASVMFKTGYKTIISFDEETRRYTIATPNIEVKNTNVDNQYYIKRIN